MTEIQYILAANIAVWLGIAGFVAFMGLRQGDLNRRLAALEKYDA